MAGQKNDLVGGDEERPAPNEPGVGRRHSPVQTLAIPCEVAPQQRFAPFHQAP